MMAESGVSGYRLEAVKLGDWCAWLSIQVEQVQLVILVAKVIDREHRSARAGQVVRRRNRLGERGELDEIAGSQLVELHRSAEIAAHEQPFVLAGIGVDVGQQRRAGPQ
jgi:hypothetical protein